MNILILLLKYFVLPILSLLIGGFLLVVIYSFFRKNRENSFVLRFIRGHYFKIKFRLTQLKNSGLYLKKNNLRQKIKIFFYKIYLKLLAQIILLCGGHKENFEILKEDLQDKHRNEISITIDNQNINIEQIAEKLKNDQLQNKDQIIQELTNKLLQLHKQRQKKTTVFSLAGFSVLTIASVAISLIAIIIMPAVRQSKAAADGVIDSVYKYAWSENIGWINFGTDEGNVHVTDSGLTGYAWSQNYGRINLSPSVSGVANDGEGNLSGYAWGENTGLINFSGVTIDSDGYFNGYADGTITGRINFNCANSDSCDNLDYKVRTDWRPQSDRPQCNNAIDDDGDGLTDYPNDAGCDSLTDNEETNSPGLPPSTQNPPTPPTGTPTPENPAGSFNISINSGNEYTRSKEVTIKLSGGPDAQKMTISNFSDFRGASLIPYQEEINWELDQVEAGSEYTVFAKFYTRYGQSSDVISDTIILDDIPPQTPIIVYPSDNSIVKIDKPSFSGTAEKESQIALELLSGQKTLSKATLLLDKEGKWSYSIPMPLADGNYQLKVYAKDEARNISKTAISNFSIQTFEWPTEPTATQETEPTTEEPITQETQPSAELTEEPTEPPLDGGTEEPMAATPNEEPSSDPANASTTEPASEPLAQPEPSGTPQTENQPQNMPTELVVVKSVYGNLNLAPVSTTDPTTEEKTISAIHAFPGQTVIFSVKPGKPVFGVAGQILFNGETAQITPKEQKENPQFQSFIDFLKPAPALAQSETDQTQTVGGGWKMQEFTYLDEDNDGIYQSEVQLPTAVNLYTLKTLLYYKDGTLKSLDTPILIDPQGYVYEKIDNQELRINKAVVSLYHLNPETKQFGLWDASSYGQKNPQEIDKDGAYSFLAPQGRYYITVQAEGYHPFESQKFDVQEGVPIVNLNLELQKEVKFEFDWNKAAIAFAMGMIGLFIAGWLIKKRKKQVY